MKNKYFVVYEIFKIILKGYFIIFVYVMLDIEKMKYVLDFLSFIIIYYFK